MGPVTGMPTRPLGRARLRVTELGFGGAPIGGFRGAVAENDAIGALRAAWDGGVRYFDTSPFYGYGRSELRVGALLRDRPRESYVLSTKVGRVLRPFDADRRTLAWRAGGLPFDADYDYSYDGTLRSIEQSMLRFMQSSRPSRLDRFPAGVSASQIGASPAKPSPCASAGMFGASSPEQLRWMTRIRLAAA